MKNLLYILFIISSFTGFSQEKKGICTSYIHLYHDNPGNDSLPKDLFRMDGFSMNNPLYKGHFLPDSISRPDTLFYELTLPFGDSLMYSAYWIADGMCYTLDSANVNSLLTILEGVPFPVIHEGAYQTYFAFNFSQTAIIKDSCFFKLQTKNGSKAYFFQIKFLDPPILETPAEEPELINDLFVWLSNENTLRIKTDEPTVWNVSLYALTGELVQTRQSEGSQDLDLSKLPKGCYIARFSSQNGLEKQLKFLK